MTETPSGPIPSPQGYRVRYLDPSALRRRAGQRALDGTWYLADRLLVQGQIPDVLRERLRVPDDVTARSSVLELSTPDDDATVTRAEQAARRQGCRLGLEVRYRHDAEDVESSSPLDLLDDEYGFVLRLVAETPDVEPDAWEVLDADLGDDATSWRLNLDHVMTSRPFTSHPFTSHPFTSHPFTSHPFTSHPFTSHPFTSHPFTSHPFTSQGVAEYGVPGSGGRAPVQWLGAAPARRVRDDGDVLRTPSGARRPVVAIVDTGIGTHPWFGTHAVDPAEWDGNDVVLREAALADGPIGTYPTAASAAEDAEIEGTSMSPLTGPLDPIAGHGTFIAGIVHQVCPDALLLPVRSVGGSGVAVESEVIESLRRLYRYHRNALDGDASAVPLDVVVLAMGYYHEQPEDLQWDHPLTSVLAQLREAGVAVVVAAGNDGETRPEFPAAFAPEVDRRGTPLRMTVKKDVSACRPPILTVGALNPDGSTALFSNDGPWVTCLRPGAGVVSTVPTTLDGPVTPSLRMKERLSESVRSTIDPEGFQGGFATWSGTSFAAPVLAGELAREILALREGVGAGAAGNVRTHGAAGDAVADRVRDVWAAITTTTGIQPEVEVASR